MCVCVCVWTSGYVPFNATTAQDNRHLVRCLWRILQISSAVFSGVEVLQRNWYGTVCISVSFRSFWTGLVTHVPLLRLPLSRNHQRLRLQWAFAHHWRGKWLNVFSDESRFNLPYNDDRVSIRRYRGEWSLWSYIVERHNGHMSSVTVWEAVLYGMRSCILRIQRKLNANCYISEVLESSFRQLHILYFSMQCPATCGEDSTSHLRRTTAIASYMAIKFAGHVTHWTRLGYGCSSWSSSKPLLNVLWTRIQPGWVGGRFARNISFIPFHDA